MNTYPYIGKFVGHTGHGIVLFAGEGEACYLDGDFETSEKYVFRDDYFECEFTNITREYLANTYGEVKSKEHAEFIVKLAEGANFNSAYTRTGFENAKSFMFYENSNTLEIYENKHTDLVNFAGKKLITIPLPPKEHEAEGISQLERKPYQCGGLWKPPIAEAIKEPEPKEWPQVGDEVLTASKRKAKLIATHDYHAWVKYYEEDNTFSLGTVTIATLSKPLTPEEELKIKLKDDLVDATIRFMSDDKNELPENAYFLVDTLMSKYEIKKKPE